MSLSYLSFVFVSLEVGDDAVVAAGAAGRGVGVDLVDGGPCLDGELDRLQSGRAPGWPRPPRPGRGGRRLG